MNKFPGSIKVKITDETGSWYATALLRKPTPEETVEYLNKVAASFGVKATYTLATQEEYDNYRKDKS